MDFIICIGDLEDRQICKRLINNTYLKKLLSFRYMLIYVDIYVNIVVNLPQASNINRKLVVSTTKI